MHGCARYVHSLFLFSYQERRPRGGGHCSYIKQQERKNSPSVSISESQNTGNLTKGKLDKEENQELDFTGVRKSN